MLQLSITLIMDKFEVKNTLQCHPRRLPMRADHVKGAYAIECCSRQNMLATSSAIAIFHIMPSAEKTVKGLMQRLYGSADTWHNLLMPKSMAMALSHIMPSHERTGANQQHASPLECMQPHQVPTDDGRVWFNLQIVHGHAGTLRRTCCRCRLHRPQAPQGLWSDWTPPSAKEGRQGTRRPWAMQSCRPADPSRMASSASFLHGACSMLPPSAGLLAVSCICETQLPPCVDMAPPPPPPPPPGAAPLSFPDNSEHLINSFHPLLCFILDEILRFFPILRLFKAATLNWSACSTFILMNIVGGTHGRAVADF